MFNRLSMISALLAIVGADVSAASAQEVTFPEKCKSSQMAAMREQMMQQPAMGAMRTEFQKEFMEGMHKTMPLMMEGMMKDDADTAFVCGMIGHHMGAIEMSRTELKHGKNDEAKAMAQKIIDAQVKEIEDMAKWVEANAK